MHTGARRQSKLQQPEFVGWLHVAGVSGTRQERGQRSAALPSDDGNSWLREEAGARAGQETTTRLP